MTEHGIYLETSKRIITSTDLPTLTEAEVQELNSTHLTKLDKLYEQSEVKVLMENIQSNFEIVNKKLDNLAKVFDKEKHNNLDDHQRIKDSMIIEVIDGEKKTIHVTEAIKDIWNYTHPNRWRNRFIKLLKENRVLVVVSGVIGALITWLLRSQLEHLVKYLLRIKQ